MSVVEQRPRGKPRGRPFEKGKSANPAGRPRGIVDRRVGVRELFVPHAAELVNKAIALAKAGDLQALRLCIERLVPPVKEDPIRFELPPIKSAADCTTAQAAVVAAVAAGEVLPSVGETLSKLIDAQRQAYQTEDIAERLDAIEHALKLKGAIP